MGLRSSVDPAQAELWGAEVGAGGQGSERTGGAAGLPELKAQSRPGFAPEEAAPPAGSSAQSRSPGGCRQPAGGGVGARPRLPQKPTARSRHPPPAPPTASRWTVSLRSRRQKAGRRPTPRPRLPLPLRCRRKPDPCRRKRLAARRTPARPTGEPGRGAGDQAPQLLQRVHGHVQVDVLAGAAVVGRLLLVQRLTTDTQLRPGLPGLGPCSRPTARPLPGSRTFSMASWFEEQNLRHSSMNRLRYRWRMTVGTLPPNSFGIMGFFKL